MFHSISSRLIKQVVGPLWIILTASTVLPLRAARGATDVLPPEVSAEPSSQVKQPSPVLVPEEPNPSSPLTPKQQRELIKSNFEKMKQEADELAELAKSLQYDLSKSNQNVLSLKVVDKAEKIEKLAKRIKDSAKGH